LWVKNIGPQYVELEFSQKWYIKNYRPPLKVSNINGYRKRW